MDEHQGDDNSGMPPPEGTRRGGMGKRVAPPFSSATSAPCGACKFLRRKCISGCIFAPYFGSDQGAARFAAVHKVFGASNVSKLLLHIPLNQRHDAVITISYEAQARLSDPIYGCVSTILALQQQVASLQAELSMVQSQLLSSRLAVANALQSSQQQQQVAVLQPAYSNNSSSSNNLVNLTSTFPSNFDLTGETVPSGSLINKTFQQSVPPIQDEEEDEEESRHPVIFTNQILNRK